MAMKLSTIIDNGADNKVLHAFQKLLSNLQKMDIASVIFEVPIS